MSFQQASIQYTQMCATLGSIHRFMLCKEALKPLFKQACCFKAKAEQHLNTHTGAMKSSQTLSCGPNQLHLPQHAPVPLPLVCIYLHALAAAVAAAGARACCVVADEP